MNETQTRRLIKIKFRSKRNIKKNLSLYLLLMIPLAYIIIFHYVPMYGAQIAFRDYNVVKGITESPWVGWKHFINFFNNYMFSRVLKNLLVISFYDIAVFPIPIFLALMINYSPRARFRKTVQMVTYAPHFISTVVMVGMVLQFLALRNGLVNTLLGAVGIGPVDFLGNPKLFSSIYVWSGVWKDAGFSSIIYIAALSGVDPEQHEAAIIDGASIFRRIWNVDIPGILPTIVILLVLRCGKMLSIGYEKVLLLQNNLNIVSSEIISTYVYKIGIIGGLPQYSYGAAVGLFISVANLVLLVTVNMLAKRISGNSLW